MSDSDSTLSRGPPLDSTAEFVGVEDPTHPAESATAAWPAGEGPRPGADGSRYIFGEVFAFGGLGLVRRAEDRRLGRVVAVKELLRDSPDAQRRFTREATITARLQHPGIVPIYDLGWRDTGEPFYSMKFVDGETLDAKIRAADGLNGRLRLLEHVIAVADAIAYAHRHGVIHRDLKPANILVGDHGETVVIDWGLAKDTTGRLAADLLGASIDPAEPMGETLTELGAIVGTLRYMPPEQARGEPVDARCDVFALGAVLFHVIAGRPPHATLDRAALLERLIADKVDDLRSVAPDAPRELAAIVQRAMSPRPDDRYPTAEAFADDLRRFLTGR
ncbi:MAG TPA: serine/threonine-protein kinase, partial [Nannocystis sp.]